jgi:cytoskeleton protein RodZ
MNAAASDEPAQNPSEAASPGELLRRERERRNMSVQQAAEDLHLDVWTVEALEDNRFSALGAPVYAKGYLRKYAALLNLSPDVVIARYESVTDRPTAPTPIPTTVSAPLVTRRLSLKKPLLILAALAVAIALWQAIEFFTSAPPTPATVAPPAVESPERSDVVASTSQTSTIEQTPAAEPPSVESPRVSEPAASAPAASPEAARVSGPQVTLRLEFSETSWAEVYDGADRRLMFDLGAPGRARTLTGVAPLRVTLGAASAVTAAVNGEPIVIPRREGRDAAKFVIDATGVVRPGG